MHSYQLMPDVPGGGESANRDVYSPGEKVRFSGIYRARHYKHRQDDGEIALFAGANFPGCGDCDDLVDYTLIRSAPGLSEDPDFQKQSTAKKSKGKTKSQEETHTPTEVKPPL